MAEHILKHFGHALNPIADISMEFDKVNDGMMIDLYELTMSNGFFASGRAGTRAVFDVFYRHNPDHGGFSIFAGLGQALEWVENLHFTGHDIDYLKTLHTFRPDFLEYLRDFRFGGDIWAFDEGTIMYPNEPVFTVRGTLPECMFLETAVLAMLNHQSLIATKARRMVRAAQGRPIADFGARRAHNIDAAVYGARAAYIGGLVATSTLEAAERFGIPASGTMAHSWVMSFDSEYEAFKAYAEEYPDNALLLIDTYDVMRSGLPNAIRLAHEFLEPMGKRLKGIRIDSGDLAYLSKKIRKQLDKEGLNDAIIVVTNSLDENTISSLLTQGAKVNSFGIGERLITAMSDPILGGVYKMAAIEENGVMVPRIKVSETAEKITNPGVKQVYRIYNQDSKAVADLIAMADETVDLSHSFHYIDPVNPWRDRSFSGFTAKPLQQLYIKDGKRVREQLPLCQIREHVQSQLRNEIWDEEQRFENPHTHFLDMTPAYFRMKQELLEKMRQKVAEISDALEG